MHTHPLIEKLMRRGLVWPGDDSSAFSRQVEQNSDHLFLQDWLRAGEVHEWSLQSGFCSEKNRTWFAPLFLLSAVLNSRLCRSRSSSSFAAWVGKHTWPSPSVLQHISSGTASAPLFLFIDPKSKSDRLWAALTALRSPAVCSVVVDASGFNFTATRRLCLAARKSSSVCISVRPSWEASRPSAAQTKWSVEPLVELRAEDSDSLRWLVSLNRARGLGIPLQWDVGVGITGEIYAKRVHAAAAPAAVRTTRAFAAG